MGLAPEGGAGTDAVAVGTATEMGCRRQHVLNRLNHSVAPCGRSWRRLRLGVRAAAQDKGGRQGSNETQPHSQRVSDKVGPYASSPLMGED